MPETDELSDAVALLTTVLESDGCKSYAACNVKTAVQLIDEISPALVCLDVILRKDSGTSLHMRLQQKEALTNVLVLIMSSIMDTGEFNFRSYAKDISVSVPGQCGRAPIDVDRYIRRIEVCWCSGDWHLRLIEYGENSQAVGEQR